LFCELFFDIIIKKIIKLRLGDDGEPEPIRFGIWLLFFNLGGGITYEK